MMIHYDSLSCYQPLNQRRWGKWCTLRLIHYHWWAANLDGLDRFYHGGFMSGTVQHKWSRGWTPLHLFWRCSFSCATHASLGGKNALQSAHQTSSNIIKPNASIIINPSHLDLDILRLFLPALGQSQVNMSCTILHFVSDPNWRPTFRYHHWSISLIAAALCAGCSVRADAQKQPSHMAKNWK